MTDPLSRIREIALLLPGTAERPDDGRPCFLVGDAMFAQLRDGGTLRLRDGDDWATIDLDGAPDWPLIEDRIARSWELVAPAGLLEAGGR